MDFRNKLLKILRFGLDKPKSCVIYVIYKFKGESQQ